MAKKLRRDSTDSVDNDTALQPTTDHTDDIELDPIEIELVQQQQHKSVYDTPKQVINNIPALTNALQSLIDSQPINVQNNWIEHLTLTSTTAVIDLLPTMSDVHDDLKREATFYSIANAAVISGLAQCESLNIPYKRPADYYVEMLKPDQHMQKIKSRLIQEKSRIESVNLRKKSLEQAKYAKAVQTEIVKQKSQVKQRAKQLQAEYKQKYNQNNSNELKIERSTLPAIDATLQSAQANKQQRHNNSSRMSKTERAALPQKGSKRKHKDEKYGSGGKKRYLKDNTSSSSRDMKQFGKSNSQGFAQFGDKFQKRGSKSSKHSKQRPGKSKRQKMSR